MYGTQKALKLRTHLNSAKVSQCQSVSGSKSLITIYIHFSLNVGCYLFNTLQHV